MNDQTKQKVLIAVLILAVLGAGSFWYMGDSSNNTVVNAGKTTRKQVERTRYTAPTKEKTRTRDRREVKTPIRKERITRTDPITKSKKRRTAGRNLEKKKKIVPAS